MNKLTLPLIIFFSSCSAIGLTHYLEYRHTQIKQARYEAYAKERQAQADADKRIGHFVAAGGSLRATFTPAELKALEPNKAPR